MKVQCPHCGNKDLEKIEWQEWVPAIRPLLGIQDGELLVDVDSEHLDSEGAKDQSLYCKSCYTEFPIPEELTVDHVTGAELAIRARGSQ